MNMTRFQIIQKFIDTRKFISFLEIGTYRGETFKNFNCRIKVSVDPDPEAMATHRMTSDKFFEQCADVFDIVFIDGLHEHNQAWRDIKNSLAHLSQGGVIVMHDCRPTSEKMQEPCSHSRQGEVWTGDVWKAYTKALWELPYHVYLLDHDWGCGIIDTAYSRPPVDMDTLKWADFNKSIMNIKNDIA